MILVLVCSFPIVSHLRPAGVYGRYPIDTLNTPKIRCSMSVLVESQRSPSCISTSTCEMSRTPCHFLLTVPLAAPGH